MYNNMIFLCNKFYQNLTKGVGGVAKTKHFLQKKLSPGAKFHVWQAKDSQDIERTIFSYVKCKLTLDL
jgi:hypothetical protein